MRWFETNRTLGHPEADADKSHLETAHFKKYKSATDKIVRSQACQNNANRPWNEVRPPQLAASFIPPFVDFCEVLAFFSALGLPAPMRVSANSAGVDYCAIYA
jgi:hypothetical protein